MNKIFKKILRLYNFVIVTSLVVYGVINSWMNSGRILAICLLGIEAYFVLAYFWRKGRGDNRSRTLLLGVLRVYSLLMSWLFLVVMVLAVRKVADLLFLLIGIPLVYDLTKTYLREVGVDKLSKANSVEEGRVADDYQIDRRKLLRLFAGTSLGLLVLYLFNPKKANAAFFGSIPGPGTVAIKDSLGAVVDPAVKNPTDGYGISGVDESAATHYYGFVHYNNIDWYILKETSGGEYTYASKVNNTNSTYSDAWSNKGTSLVFGTYAQAF